MTTQYTPILKLALPVQGELSGTWGDVVNDNITSMVEQAIAGRSVIDTWSANSHVLTTANGTAAESRAAMLSLTDSGTALTGAGSVICPALSKVYIVKNGTAQVITVKTAAGSGIAVPVGKTMLVYCDGTNVLEAVDHVVTLSAGTLTITGLTTFASLKGTGAVTVTNILDEDNMASDSATALVTQQSIKAYVDSQVGANNELSEVLANGNTTGTNDIDVDAAQKVQFRDAAIYINSSVDGQLDIVADTEIQIDTTTVDINGAVDVSGTLDVTGAATFSGNLGIGTSSPTYKLDGGFANQTWGWYLNDSYNAGMTYNTAERSLLIHTKSADVIDHIKFATGGSALERLRIDAVGNLLVGTTDPNVHIGTASGAVITSAGFGFFAVSSNAPIYANRLTNDGAIIDLRKDGTSVGSIGTGNNGNLYLGSGDTGINFNSDINSVYPINPSNGAASNGAIDLGYNGIAFKDLWLSGTVNAGAATFSAGITATTGAFSGGVNITDSSYGIYSTAVAATIGYIGNSANDLTIFSSTAGHNGLRFHDNGILPIDNTGALVDADADLGIGTYRFKDLYLSGTVNAGAATFSGVVKVNTALALGDINLTQTADAKGIVIVDSTESGALKLQHNAASSYIANNDTRNMVFATNSLDRVTIDGSTGAATFSGNVTIGSQTFISTTGGVYVDGGYTTRVTASGSGAAGHDMLFYTGTGAGSERLRIDASGNLLVGKAASSFTTAGVELAQGGTAGKVQIQRSSSPLALVNLTDDGSILNFYKGTTSVGSIGTLGGNLFIGSPNGTAAHLRLGEGGIFPSDSGGYNRNAAIDLGGISSKFKDLYLSGGAIIGGGGTSQTGVISFVADSERARIEGGYQAGGGGYIKFNTDTPGGSNLERMRLDASGNLLVAKTTAGTVLTHGVELSSAGGVFSTTSVAGNSSYFVNLASTGTRYLQRFYASTTFVGSITSTGTATAYNTTSDYRLKEDDVPMTGATERVKALRPINFAWKLDGSRVDGFFAHELAEVVPEAATGTKDAMRDEEYEVTPAVEEVRDEDDNIITEAAAAVMGTRSVPDYQGIDQSKLVPLLTAALQEAIAKIEALTARLEALEGA